MPPSDSLLLAAARDLNAALGDLGVVPTFIGGVAVSLLATPRQTDDLDALIIFDTARVSELLEALGKHGFEPRFSKMEQLAQEARMVTLCHVETGSVVDIALGCMPFEEEVQSRAGQHRVGDMDIRLPTPEDLIILKAIAHRPKDLEDIRSVAKAYPGIDRKRIRQWIEQYAGLMDTPEVWAEIEPML